MIKNEENEDEENEDEEAAIGSMTSEDGDDDGSCYNSAADDGDDEQEKQRTRHALLFVDYSIIQFSRVISILRALYQRAKPSNGEQLKSDQEPKEVELKVCIRIYSSVLD